MAFLDRLAANPSGSGIAGAVAPESYNQNNLINLVNTIKDRDMNDFKAKANFMSDLSMRQNRMNSIYDPGQTNSNIDHPMNTVLGKDPNAISPTDQVEIGLKKQGLGLEQQKIAQTGKLGEEAVSVRTAQEKLNQQKSDQINDLKMNDLQRKSDEANSRLDLANKALTQKGDNATAMQQLSQARIDALQAQHDLDNHRRDAQAADTQKMHEAAMKNMQDKLDLAGQPTTVKTDVTNDASGNPNSVTKTTSKGSSRIKVTGPNGESGTVDSSETLPDGWSKVQ